MNMSALSALFIGALTSPGEAWVKTFPFVLIKVKVKGWLGMVSMGGVEWEDGLNPRIF